MRKAIWMLLVVSGCGVDRVTAVEEDFFVEQTRIELGRVWVGRAVEVTVPVESRSRFELTLDADGAPLEVPPAGVAELRVVIERVDAGAFERRVLISGERQSVEVVIAGEAAIVPDCAARNDCVRATFDFERGECVEDNLAEGTACGGERACIASGRCEAGECRGEAVSCDDGNACTDDACSVGQGCIHVDSSARCEVTGSCVAGSCDPSSGCVTTEVADGTSCGPADCATAHVCMSGACVERAVPEGSSCGENSPCQAAGQCVSGACVQPAATVLQPAWSYSSGGAKQIRPPLVMDESGHLLFVECGDTGCDLVSLSAGSVLRFRVALSGIAAVRDLSVARGRVFVASAGREMVIHSASTGAKVAAVDTYALVQTSLIPMSVAASSTDATILAIAADGAGRLYAIVAVTSYAGDSATSRGTFLLAFDDATGTLLWKRRAKHFSRLVVNEAGRLFTTEWPEAAPSTGRLLSLDATGTELFAVETSDAPVAAHAGRLLTTYGAVRNANTGEGRSSSVAVDETVLLQNDSVWSVPAWECFPSQPRLYRQSVADRSMKFDTVLDPSPSAYVIAPSLLTQSQSVLVALQTANNSSTLKEVGATGSISFSCELGGASGPRSAVLGGSRYFVLDVDYSVQPPYPTSVRAYDVPGRLPAVSGWVGPGGGPQHSSRPR